MICAVFLLGRPAYLDFQATTPMDPRVLDAMMPYMTERFGETASMTVGVADHVPSMM